MTKDEMQQLSTLVRYIESGLSLMDSGRIQAGKDSMEMAKVLAEVMLSIGAKKNPQRATFTTAFHYKASHPGRLIMDLSH